MTSRILSLAFMFTVGAIVGHIALPSGGAQTRKPSYMMTRLYTGADNQTHAEEIEMKFTAGGPDGAHKMMQVTGAELHRGSAGSVQDWHAAPSRRYVITLSGRGELEVSG